MCLKGGWICKFHPPSGWKWQFHPKTFRISPTMYHQAHKSPPTTYHPVRTAFFFHLLFTSTNHSRNSPNQTLWDHSIQETTQLLWAHIHIRHHCHMRELEWVKTFIITSCTNTNTHIWINPPPHFSGLARQEFRIHTNFHHCSVG